MTEDEWQVRIIEEEVEDIARRLQNLLAKLGQAEETLLLIRQGNYGAAAVCSTTVTGQARGCTLVSPQNLPNGTVLTFRNAGGTVLGTATVSGGIGGFTGTFNLDVASGSQTLTIEISSAGGNRFNTLSRSVSCTSASLGLLDFTPATGYHCLLSAFSCIFPIADTLYLTDSIYGSTTLHWQPGSGGRYWKGSITGIHYNCADCAPNPPQLIDVEYWLDGIGLAFYIYWYSDFAVFDCPTAGGPVNDFLGISPTTQSCPPSFAFSGTTGGLGTPIYCNATSTITVTE